MSIKEPFVEQVLERLRSLALDEATLLVNEQKRHPCMPLPEISVRLSRVINDAADAVADGLPQWSEKDLELARQLVAEHLPSALREAAGDDLAELLPEAYLSRLITVSLVTGIVYREGIDFFASMEPEIVSEMACRYLRKQGDVETLVNIVKSSGLDRSKQIADLLKRGGTSALLRED